LFIGLVFFSADFCLVRLRQLADQWMFNLLSPLTASPLAILIRYSANFLEVRFLWNSGIQAEVPTSEIHDCLNESAAWKKAKELTQ